MIHKGCMLVSIYILRKYYLSMQKQNKSLQLFLSVFNSIIILSRCRKNEHSVDEGVQTVCLGELVLLIFTHDNVAGQQTRLTVSGSQPCEEILSHFTLSTEDMCGLFTITRIGNTCSFYIILNYSNTCH